jgi:Uma2 family endonuclease
MSAPVSVSRRLLSVEEYHKIGEAGVLGEDDRVELIDGEMIEMAPIGSRHVAKVNRFARLLSRSVEEQAIISIQNPIALPPHNEPQPDIALLKPRADDYETKLPGAEDVLLIIEIADTTLTYDRDAKIPIYARQGIVEVWLLDVQTRSLSMFLDPGPKGYQRLLTPERSDTIAPSLLPSVTIRLSDLW